MYRERIQQRIEQIGGHPAWGLAHCQRVYELAMQLGGDRVDEEIIYAAAMTHDFGAYPEYREEGTDHAVRSTVVVRAFLNEVGFPADKIDRVIETIRGHMFYDSPDESLLEAVVFHDADVLDFMGTIGTARLISIVGLDDWAKTLPDAIALIEQFSDDLPDKVYTDTAKEMAGQRAQEMKDFLATLRQQTMNLASL